MSAYIYYQDLDIKAQKYRRLVLHLTAEGGEKNENIQTIMQKDRKAVK